MQVPPLPHLDPHCAVGLLITWCCVLDLVPGRPRYIWPSTPIIRSDLEVSGRLLVLFKLQKEKESTHVEERAAGDKHIQLSKDSYSSHVHYDL